MFIFFFLFKVLSKHYISNLLLLEICLPSNYLELATFVLDVYLSQSSISLTATIISFSNKHNLLVFGLSLFLPTFIFITNLTAFFPFTFSHAQTIAVYSLISLTLSSKKTTPILPLTYSFHLLSFIIVRHIHLSNLISADSNSVNQSTLRTIQNSWSHYTFVKLTFQVHWNSFIIKRPTFFSISSNCT